MGRKSKRSKKLFTTIVITLSIILISTIIVNFLTFNQNKKIVKENKNLETKYQEYATKNTSDNETIKKYKEDIKFLTNINENINSMKKELFANAKLLEDSINSGTSNKKIVYITFDDGPYYLTYKYLDVLNKYKIKATFFTIGTGKSKCYDNSSANCYPVLKAIVDNGHTIANHTYSHAIWKGLYTSADTFISSLVKQENLIKEYTGVITNITRFPGGSSTPGKTKKNNIIAKLKERNYGWVDWTASDGDGGAISSKDKAWSNFTSSINSKIEVLLLHDYSTISLALLPKMIEYLQSNNYVILPLFYESCMINK